MLALRGVLPSMRTLILTTLLLTGCGGPAFIPQLFDEGDGGAGDDGGSEAASHAVEVPDAGAPAEEASVEASPEASSETCVNDLSNVGTGNFTIAFTVTVSRAPAPSVFVSLLNQRAGCTTTSSYWEVAFGSWGGVTASTYNGADGNPIHFVEGSTSIADGKPHHVKVQRVADALAVWVDGALGSAQVIDTDALGAMAPLTIGSEPCANILPSEGYATVEDICLSP
jgi:hypothetical protein